MRIAFLVAALSLAAPLSRAETLSGSIDDPDLRRKTQLVYVETVAGKFTPPATAAVMNQIGNTYVPKVLPVMAGQKVEFRSRDPELHNVYARAGERVLFNQAVLPKKMFETRMEQPAIVHLSCNIHKQMSADIVVLQNPFYAVPDARTGKFTIDGLPAGTYSLRIFGPELSDEQKAQKFSVTVGGAPVQVM
jgi:plastocyanin